MGAPIGRVPDVVGEAEDAVGVGIDRTTFAGGFNLNAVLPRLLTFR